VLSGVHVGCYELFAHEGINSVMDLKGRSVGGGDLGSDPHVFVSAMPTHVGLNPLKGIHWTSDFDPMELFAQRKVDAFLALSSAPGAARPNDLPCDSQERLQLTSNGIDRPVAVIRNPERYGAN
jgi:NitT/TauT family transport system substrate-binding protein